MKDAGTGTKPVKKYRRAALVRAEKYQAEYFRYPALGWLALIMPAWMLRAYMERRFYEQPETNQHAFERMTVQNRSRRERMIRTAAGK